MNLNEVLNASSHFISDITKIYHGKENCCRCGCKGRYFKPNDVGFKRALNAMQKASFIPLQKGVDMQAYDGIRKCEGIVYGENYIDIPYDAERDKCYCLYFA